MLTYVQVHMVEKGYSRETLANHVDVGVCMRDNAEENPLACLHAMCGFEERKVKWRMNLATILYITGVTLPLIITCIMAWSNVSLSRACNSAFPIAAVIIIIGAFTMKQTQDFFYIQAYRWKEVSQFINKSNINIPLDVFYHLGSLGDLN